MQFLLISHKLLIEKYSFDQHLTLPPELFQLNTAVSKLVQATSMIIFDVHLIETENHRFSRVFDCSDKGGFVQLRETLAAFSMQLILRCLAGSKY